MIYKLWYTTRDQGDGSVYTRFFETQAEAIRAEEQDLENGGNGWSESSVSYVELKSDSPILFSDYGMINGQYKKIFNLLKGEDGTVID